MLRLAWVFLAAGLIAAGLASPLAVTFGQTLGPPPVIDVGPLPGGSGPGGTPGTGSNRSGPAAPSGPQGPLSPPPILTVPLASQDSATSASTASDIDPELRAKLKARDETIDSARPTMSTPSIGDLDERAHPSAEHGR